MSKPANTDLIDLDVIPGTPIGPESTLATLQPRDEPGKDQDQGKVSPAQSSEQASTSSQLVYPKSYDRRDLLDQIAALQEQNISLMDALKAEKTSSNFNNNNLDICTPPTHNLTSSPHNNNNVYSACMPSNNNNNLAAINTNNINPLDICTPPTHNLTSSPHNNNNVYSACMPSNNNNNLAAINTNNTNPLDIYTPPLCDAASPSNINSLVNSVNKLNNDIHQLLLWKQTLTTSPPVLHNTTAKRNIKREHFRPINPIDLNGSLNYFELELALQKFDCDTDRLRAAALVFPQSVVEGFRRVHPDPHNWTYSGFKEYIMNKLPQRHSCHQPYLFSSTPTLLDLDNIASKDATCPHDELYKFFIIHRAPTWAKDAIRENLRLDISQFKACVDSILSSGAPRSTRLPPSSTGRTFGPSRIPNSSSSSSLCSYHNRFGRSALTCIGPQCPMYTHGLRAPSGVRPRNGNPGNY